MPTASDIITQSLKAVGVLGVGQTPLAEDINDGLTSLRQMISQWQGRRWLVPSLVDIYAVGNNAISNTVGPGEYFDIAVRPDKIQAAYFRQNFSGGVPSPQSVDYPLKQIFSREDYSTITLKGLNSFPYAFFYDNEVPVGNVYVWPIPNETYQVHLVIKNPFTIPDLVTDTLVFAPEYEEALWTNLAVRMCATYDREISSAVGLLAKVSLNTIKNSNAQVPSLRMPYFGNNGWYNIFSDTGG